MLIKVKYYYSSKSHCTKGIDMKNDNTTNSESYKGYTINNGKEYTSDCYISILDKIIEKTTEMAEKHSKVLVSRIDIHKPQDKIIENPNRKCTRIKESFKKEMNRVFKDSPHNPDVNIISTSERNDSGRQTHEHLYIIANGNAIQNAWRFQDSLNRHTKRIFDSDKDGLVHFCESNGDKGIMIDRNDDDFQEQLDKAIYAGSYLAKTKGKDLLPKGTHKVTSSRKN